jgi:hypothetical protein
MEPYSVANFNSESSEKRRTVTLSSRSVFSRLCNGFLMAFERVTRAGRLPNVSTLLSIAERQTGLNDFGDHRFLERSADVFSSNMSSNCCAIGFISSWIGSLTPAFPTGKLRSRYS